MKGEPKLRLVPPTGGGGEEPSPTDAELREAAAMRDALEAGADPLAAALRAAFDPASLDDDESDALLARALGDIDAPATKVERAGASRLAAELEAPRASGPKSEEAEVAGALKAAWAPRALNPLKNEALIVEALRSAEPARPRRVRVLSITAASITAVAAMAAGILLFIARAEHPGGSAMETAAAPPSTAMAAAQAALIRARSSEDLFDASTPFPKTGGESARMDRIASARAADLRANRFAAWGVR